MFAKDQIEKEIATLEEQLKTAAPHERGSIEVSRRVWLGRLVAWKAGRYICEEPDPETKPKRKRNKVVNMSYGGDPLNDPLDAI